MAGLGSKMKTWVILHLLLCYLIVASGLIVSILMACTLVVWPFNKNLYRKINSYLAYSWWCRKYNKNLKTNQNLLLSHISPTLLFLSSSYSSSQSQNSKLSLQHMIHVCLHDNQVSQTSGIVNIDIGTFSLLSIFSCILLSFFFFLFSFYVCAQYFVVWVRNKYLLTFSHFF